jgi:hypothetical protein
LEADSISQNTHGEIQHRWQSEGQSEEFAWVFCLGQETHESIEESVGHSLFQGFDLVVNEVKIRFPNT